MLPTRWLTCVSLVLSQMLVVYLPWLQRVFQTEGLSLNDLLFILLLTSSMVVLDTARKVLFPDRLQEPHVSYESKVHQNKQYFLLLVEVQYSVLRGRVSPTGATSTRKVYVCVCFPKCLFYL